MVFRIFRAYSFFCVMIVFSLPLLALAKSFNYDGNFDTSASQACMDIKMSIVVSTISTLVTSGVSLIKNPRFERDAIQDSPTSTILTRSTSTTTANNETSDAAIVVQGASSLAIGVKVGLGVGIPIAVLVTFGIGFYFMRRYWQRKLERYKKNDSENSDTVVILPSETSSRPNTSYTTAPSMSASIKTASDIRALGGEIPDLPTYFPGDIISSAGVPGGYSSSGNAYHSTEKKDFEMHTYAIEIGDSTPDDKDFPINAFVVEMDAHEPKADNEGIFELGLPSPRLPVEIEQNTVEIVSEPEPGPKLEPAPEITNDLSTLPSQRLGFQKLQLLETSYPSGNEAKKQEEAEQKPDDIIEKNGSYNGQARIIDVEETFPLQEEDESLHGIPIDDTEKNISEDKIVSQSIERGITPVAEPANPPLEKRRGRSQARSVSSKSLSSIPRSQFSRSSSTPRALPRLDSGTMPLPASAQKRTARSMSRGRTHISAMIVETRPKIPGPAPAHGLLSH